MNRSGSRWHMPTFTLAAIWALILMLACTVGAFPSTAQEYVVTNLNLPGSTNATVGPKGINSAGQVTGTQFISLFPHAFFYDGTSLQDIGTLGGSYSYGRGVNNSGQVVGNSTTVAGSWHAFLWTQASGMVDLGTLPGNCCSDAWAINDSGQVVGQSKTAAGPYHAFLWTQAGGMVDLNDHIPRAPAGLELGAALALSDNGSIVALSNAGLVLLSGSSTAPVVGPISANDPVAAGSLLSMSASFTDADTFDTHTAVWTWGDGSPTDSATVSESGGNGSASGSHSFSAAGIYTVSLTVTDNTGRTAEVSRDIVVYDPSAGFVTGGGWIISPVGAYKEDVTLAGRANFGFVSKYQKGANIPIGNTEFQFDAASLNFHSDNYSWLVVAGTRAQYKGIGTINGSGNYDFKLTAIDGQIPGGGGVDRFRIKIWYYDDSLKEDVVVYDNQIDPSNEGTSTEGTEVRGGSIMIHK